MLLAGIFLVRSTYLKKKKGPGSDQDLEPEPDQYLWLTDPDPAGPHHADPTDPDSWTLLSLW